MSIILDSIYFSGFREFGTRLEWAAGFVKWFIPADLVKKRKEHLRLSREKLSARLQRESKQYDFFSNFLSSNKSSYSKEGFLLAQANVLIIAGSETTATTLAAIAYYLTTDHVKLQRLQDEVRSAFDDPKKINGDSASRLPYLHSVIEESLRLFPPVPFGPPRVSTGVTIDGHYVPSSTVVSTLPYATTRSPRYWEAPLEFEPERWLPADHPFHEARFDNDNKNASKPFMLGPRACLGINLAYVELRIMLARLVWQFDWHQVEQDVNWDRDTKLLVLWSKPQLKVRFSPRAN